MKIYITLWYGQNINLRADKDAYFEKQIIFFNDELSSQVQRF